MRALAELASRSRQAVQWYQARVPSWLRIALVVGWAGFIWWLSSQPSVPHPPNPVFSHLWNLGHVVVFGVLAGLVLLSTQGCTVPRAIVAVLVAATYGVLDEMHQGFVEGRHADVWDVVSDGLGACLMASGLCWVVRRDRRAGVVFLVCLPLVATSVHLASS